jgi:hypothetical protein
MKAVLYRIAPLFPNFGIFQICQALEEVFEDTTSEYELCDEEIIERVRDILEDSKKDD